MFKFLYYFQWSKNYPIFSKDFILFPINEHYHWSLVIILYPDKIKNIFIDNNNQSNDYPVILYLDSIKHLNSKCVQIIEKYLIYEYAIKNNILNELQLPEFIEKNDYKIDKISLQVLKYDYIYRFRNKKIILIVEFFY